MIYIKKKKDIIRFLKSSIEDFIKENPNEVAITLGIYICPWAGWLSTNFDTQNNSDEFVKKYKDKGKAWFGQDEAGDYCNNCPDFKYPDFSNLQRNNWQEQYENDEKLKVKTGLFKIKTISEEGGNEAVNEVYFNYFVDILNEISRDELLRQLKKSSNFRVGIQLLDSEYICFRTL